MIMDFVALTLCISLASVLCLGAESIEEIKAKVRKKGSLLETCEVRTEGVSLESCEGQEDVRLRGLLRENVALGRGLVGM